MAKYSGRDVRVTFEESPGQWVNVGCDTLLVSIPEIKIKINRVSPLPLKIELKGTITLEPMIILLRGGPFDGSKIETEAAPRELIEMLYLDVEAEGIRARYEYSAGDIWKYAE